MAGERTGFAYSDEVVPAALLEAARAARAIAREGGKGQVQAWHATAAHRLYPADDPIATLADVDKVALLQELDRRARALDPRVRQVVATLAAVHEIILIAASDGTLAADVRPLVRMNVSVIVEQNGRREQGYAGTGGRYSLAGIHRGREAAAARARGRAPGDGQPRIRAGARGHDDRRARPGLARRAAARSDRPRPRGRLQPPRHVRVHRPDRRAGRLRALHRRGRRHAAGPARLAQHRRRGHADVLHDADRERRAEGLPAGQAERAAHGREADRQRAPRVLRAHDAAAHDEHLHAARARTTPARSSARSSAACTR